MLTACTKSCLTALGYEIFCYTLNRGVVHPKNNFSDKKKCNLEIKVKMWNRLFQIVPPSKVNTNMSLYQFYFIYILFPTKSFNALSETTMETTQFTLKNIVLEQ